MTDFAASATASKATGHISSTESAPSRDARRSIIADLRALFSFVPARRRRQLIPVMLLMLLGAVAELASIGAILPFLALIADPNGALAAGPLRAFLAALGFDTPFKAIAAVAVLFGLAALVAAAVRLLLVWVSQRFVFGMAQELSVEVFRKTLHQPYLYHTVHNSSETLAAIGKAQSVTTGFLAPLMQAASASVIALFIIGGLLVIDPVVALAAGLGFAGIYLIVMRVTRAVMVRNGAIVAEAAVARLQTTREGLGGIRDVVLDGSQSVFVERLAIVEARLRRAQATNSFLGAAPRFVVEGLGLGLMAGLAVPLSLRADGLIGALPVLGALALGGQRLIPLFQQIYQGWAGYQGSSKMVAEVLAVLRLPIRTAPPSSTLKFLSTIKLEKVSFTYPLGDRPVLREVDLVIPKGARVGIRWHDRGGKSTLMDIVLGLLPPTIGRLLVDGVEITDANRAAWQARIAHVPQSIYLSDATVAENIAFGVPKHEMDMDRVTRAAQQAQLADVIANLPKGYDTYVGDNGMRLSGGQRQRLGIARALYREADVLVLDEATSALDGETEQAVVEAVAELDRSLTVLIVAHRTTTLQQCAEIVRVERYLHV